MGMIIDENGNVDFQEWKVPTSWDDITVEKFSELERFYEGKDEKFNPIDVLHILCDKTADEVMALPIDFVEKILGQMEFLQTVPTAPTASKPSFVEKILGQIRFLHTAPKAPKPSNSIEINGEKYTVHTERQIKTGEFVAVDTVLKADRHDYASIMAILCRKDGEEYDSKFENEILPDRIELFKKQPITKILPIVTFFLSIWAISIAPSQLSSLIKEELNNTAKNIETLRKDGRLSLLSTMRLRRKLKKLRKSISHI
jgi:hypothetical protein